MWRSLRHFALLGAALFAADRFWWRADPPAVVIPAARVAVLRDDLTRALGRPPAPEELERAIAPELDDELLYRAALARGYERDDPVVFRRLVQNLRFAGASEQRGDASLFDEALALRMHESDVVVRRRLVQRMRLDLEALAPTADPDETALREHYERNALRYQSPERVRLAQLYFRGEREAEARRVLAQLRAGGARPGSARAQGDPFLHPAEQPPQTRDELADRFGAAFADGVAAALPGDWSGPIPSAYGVHLVWVHERFAARALALDEVRDSVRYAVIAERRQRALEHGLSALRDGASVVVEEPDSPTR